MGRRHHARRPDQAPAVQTTARPDHGARCCRPRPPGTRRSVGTVHADCRLGVTAVIELPAGGTLAGWSTRAKARRPRESSPQLPGRLPAAATSSRGTHAASHEPRQVRSSSPPPRHILRRKTSMRGHVHIGPGIGTSPPDRVRSTWPRRAGVLTDGSRTRRPSPPNPRPHRRKHLVRPGSRVCLRARQPSRVVNTTICTDVDTNDEWIRAASASGRADRRHGDGRRNGHGRGRQALANPASPRRHRLVVVATSLRSTAARTWPPSRQAGIDEPGRTTSTQRARASRTPSARSTSRPRRRRPQRDRHRRRELSTSPTGGPVDLHHLGDGAGAAAAATPRARSRRGPVVWVPVREEARPARAAVTCSEGQGSSMGHHRAAPMPEAARRPASCPRTSQLVPHQARSDHRRDRKRLALPNP